MFDITCPTCQIRSIRTTRDIESFANTLDGPVAVVTCPRGHHVTRNFRSGQTCTGSTQHETVCA